MRGKEMSARLITPIGIFFAKELHYIHYNLNNASFNKNLLLLKVKIIKILKDFCILLLHTCLVSVYANSVIICRGNPRQTNIVLPHLNHCKQLMSNLGTLNSLFGLP